MNSPFLLVGPTASGKTAVANELARRMNAIVLSADSMLVYRGMDIGTAKPTPAELVGIDFRGANLVAPDEEFSAGKWLETAHDVLDEAQRAKRPVIIVGGTGLYFNALIRGLDAPASHDLALRAELESLTLPELTARAESLSPGSTLTLSDPRNPRRVIRLIEILSAPNSTDERAWERGRLARNNFFHAKIAGLNAPNEILAARIHDRARKMFADGLLDEAARLRREYPEFSRTAGKGIGYAEALAALDGTMSVSDAIEKTALRTRQLAKRQRTWFRHQMDVKWVLSPVDTSDVSRAADEVAAIWNE